MCPDRFSSDATESAVEKLLLVKNGERKTITDVFELVLAVNEDARHRDGVICSNIEKHLSEHIHMTNAEFDAFIEGFVKKHDARDAIVAAIERDLTAMRENCIQIHASAQQTENWGRSYGDDADIGDLKRAWRFLKWVVIVLGGAFLVAIGDQLSHRIFGT